MSGGHDERLEALEIKLAYQEHTIAELNEVIVTQQHRLDQLETICRALREKLRSLADNAGADANTHEPPPHY